MIRTVVTSNGEPSFEASVNGLAIYLDNWAIKAFAKGDPALRQRFIATLHDGADLLFSTAHAIEIIGPQGSSSAAFRAFMNDIGAHWYPVEVKVFEVTSREQRGLSASKCCYDEDLLRVYFQSGTSEHVRGSGKIIDLSERFFRLGAFVDWLTPQRDGLRATTEQFDRIVKESVNRLRAKLKQDSSWFDRVLPPHQFNPSYAATFACTHLLRELVSDSGLRIKKGDGMDFGHAVMASAFSNFATLDRQWKRRVENLPKPNRNPRIYYAPELGKMVEDIESALVQLKALRKSPLAL